MATDYTTAASLDALAGTLAIDLRGDDAADQAALTAAAVTAGSTKVDFYCQGRWTEAVLAANDYVNQAATAFALEWYCLRRLNDVPASLKAYCDEFREQLKLVMEGRAVIPRAARARRAITVTNPVVVLRKPNNQVRVDRSRSTGKRDGYAVPYDETAPDAR